MARRFINVPRSNMAFLPQADVVKQKKAGQLYFTSDTKRFVICDADRGLHSADFDNLVTQGAGISVVGNTVSIRNAANLTDGYVPRWGTANNQFANSAIRSTATYIGVGAAPQSFVHVYENDARVITTADQSTMILEQNGAGDVGIQFELTGGQRWSIGIDNSNASDAFVIYDITDSRNCLTIDGSGNVGIHTAAPAHYLHIDSPNGTFAQGLRLSYNANASGWSMVTGTDANLYIGNGASASETLRLVLTDAGNVGIGVADPDTKLEVFYAGTQIKCSYNAGDYGTLAADDNGDMTIGVSGSHVIIQSGKDLRLGNARQAGDPATDGYVLIEDSTGTQYKVPCLAA